MATVLKLTEQFTKESGNKEAAFFRSSPVLDIKNLSISLHGGNGQKERILVKKLNFSIRPGEILGLAGESGSGKSLTASAILGLLPKSLKVSEGQIKFDGRELTSLSGKEMGRLRGKEIAYISQNYQGSFTPFMKIGKQLVEALRSHDKISKRDAKKKALIWLERVKLPAERIFASYPHQLSGGQLQRASLAAALMFEPTLIIADEPTTALDVLTGERVLDLLAELQKDLNCAVLFISHNLSYVLKRTDSMAVMYGGQIVEKGLTKSIRGNPAHPYTKLLLKARPVLSQTVPEKFAAIPGEPGLVAEQGCSFALRCPHSSEQCSIVPMKQSVGDFHWMACHVTGKE
ncbi:ABC transporter ATP-binding protein [Domibacillus sp. A3M-37]|uniref:ABC transporter ATP-binding protein n=1 Tax=Domibacillus sp. A3M-37 TaxID=2962037 RepID=UPI0020B7CB3C|nr:ABC transporter ATP-binding protein [Domibacillus sp. A3M-37]MCP3765028.1 ABC transporter ATP-binding protein [Domibacillus sp. A3M-37]